MPDLDDKTYDAIQAHCEDGNKLSDEGLHAEAGTAFKKAYDLLPEPVEQWEAFTWILTALGDCAYLSGDYTRAREHLSQALVGPGGMGLPFIHLRLGQSQLELGNEERARDELARAYMGAGSEIFEDEDPRYLHYLKQFMEDID